MKTFQRAARVRPGGTSCAVIVGLIVLIFGVVSATTIRSSTRATSRSASAGEVVLTGTVPSRQARRLAEELAGSVSGVGHVQNDLRTRGYGTGTQEAPRRVA